MPLRTLPARAVLIAGAALLAIGGVASAQVTYGNSAAPPAPPAPPTPPAPPAPPAPPEAPTPPDAPLVDRAEIDRAEIDREVAEGMAEARESIAEARKEIAEARAEIMREKDMPAAARAEALAALDKAERDVAQALSQHRAD